MFPTGEHKLSAPWSNILKALYQQLACLKVPVLRSLTKPPQWLTITNAVFMKDLGESNPIVRQCFLASQRLLTNAPLAIFNQVRIHSEEHQSISMWHSSHDRGICDVLAAMDSASSLRSIELYLPLPSDKHAVLELFQKGAVSKVFTSVDGDRIARLPLFQKDVWYETMHDLLLTQQPGSLFETCARQFVLKIAPACSRADIERVMLVDEADDSSFTAIVKRRALWGCYPDAVATFSMFLPLTQVLKHNPSLHSL